MAYTNNGAYRQLELVVAKTTGGTTATQTLSLLPAFSWNGTDFAALTAGDLQRLPEAAFQQRLAAFLSWAQAELQADPAQATNKPHGLTTDADAPQGLSCPVAAW